MALGVLIAEDQAPIDTRNAKGRPARKVRRSDAVPEHPGRAPPVVSALTLGRLQLLPRNLRRR